MERIGGEVKRELGRFGPAESDMVEIVRAWPDAVGETVARNAWPARLSRDGTLHVNASSSTWAFELGRLAEAILEQLRAKLGDEAVPPTLKFVPGPIPEPAPEAAAAGAPKGLEVGADERLEGAAIAASIEDDELRAIVARAAAASLAKARSGRSF
jgi:hypothetical protein